ncbi:MAG: 3'-5' exonuclease, partial [Bacteroidetes bacterium]
NHQLGTLVSYCGLKAEDVFHRALADAEMTARLWCRMTEDIQAQYRIPRLTFRQMEQLARKPRHAVGTFLEHCRDEAL